MSNTALENFRRKDPENPFQKLPNGADFICTSLFNIIKNLSDEEIKAFLNQEITDKPAYGRTWQKASEEHLQNKYAAFVQMPDIYNIAIIAYIMDPGLYSDFNSTCRRLFSEISWEHFPYKSLFALLSRAIHRMPDVNENPFYRGMTARVHNLEVSDLVHPSQFMLCSTLKREASAFVEDGGTLVTFKGSSIKAIGIVRHSLPPQKKEFLVSPWSCFKVIQRRRQVDHLVLESHTTMRF